MNANYWTAHADLLANAYTRSEGTIRFELVTRALQAFLSEPGRIIDIGGGYGRQAVMLARAGHSVTVLDIDPRMLRHAEMLAASEPEPVRARMRFILGEGQRGTALAGSGYDLVCCHSVLMYEDDPSPLIGELVRLARPEGLISILSVNPACNAMRSGLQARWKEVVATLQHGVQMDSLYLECREHTIENVGAALNRTGAHVLDWHGVGVFTDHLTDTIVADDPAEVILAEWLAGTRDPYRQVARCFHLIAQRDRDA